MASFLKDSRLNSEIEKIFEEASELLILISPFIKLHPRFESILKAKIDNDKLRIFIVFGKNEKDITKSLASKDLEFFKQFPNIEIKYEKRLHAKFYANEKSQVLTSMNLYEHSQNENIEFGVLTEVNPLNNLASTIVGKNLDQEAWDYFMQVIDNSELLFKNEPVYKKKWDGIRNEYVDIKNVKDKITEHFMLPNLSHKSSVNQSISVKTFSASQLSKLLSVSQNDITDLMQKIGFINGDKITEVGISKGLVMKSYMGKNYISYPENLNELSQLKK